MKKENKSTGISLSGICITIFLVFLILKLTHVIDWSWWAVCLPLIIPVGLFLVIFIIAFLALVIREILKAID